MERNIIIARQVRALFKARGLKTSRCALQAINREVLKLCLHARDKALADQMKTVKGAHIEL